MWEGKDHMVMVTRQQPRLLEGQPTFDLEKRALRTRPVPTRVVPDTGDVAVRTRLDMATQRRGPALHDSARGGADVGRQGMALLIGGKGVLEDRLQRDERHRCLRTHGRRRVSGCFLQYHANHPREKRLVQGILGHRLWICTRSLGQRKAEASEYCHSALAEQEHRCEMSCLRYSYRHGNPYPPETLCLCR